MLPLTDEESKVYSRQILLPELGLSGQQKLKSSSVLVIGAGGLGCPILQYLAAAGIGKIGIVDDDVIEESNLHRQILYSSSDIGKSKAQVAADKIRILNPLISVRAYSYKFEQENAKEIILPYDLIIDGSDNFKTRYLVNDVCVEASKPWVFGSIYKFEGQVAVFNYQDGAVYRDVYPKQPVAEAIPNCDEIGTTGILPGIIGLFMANEALKVLVGFGDIISNKLLNFDALTCETTIYKIKKSLKVDDTKIPEIMPSEDKEIDLETLEQWQKINDFTLLDIREDWEFEDFNRGGINIPLSKLPEKLATIAHASKIVCCCNYGNKSKIAIKLIQDAYPEIKVYSLKGGIGDEY